MLNKPFIPVGLPDATEKTKPVSNKIWPVLTTTFSTSNLPIYDHFLVH